MLGYTMMLEDLVESSSIPIVLGVFLEFGCAEQHSIT